MLESKGFSLKRENLLNRVQKIIKDKEERIRESKMQKAKQRIVDEMEGCTFKPKINKKSRKSSGKRRTVEDLIKWKSEKEEKVNKLKMEREQSKRKIGKRKVLEGKKRRRNSVRVEDRLLNMHKKKVEKINKLREESFCSLTSKKGKRRGSNLRFRKNPGVSKSKRTTPRRKDRVVDSKNFLQKENKKGKKSIRFTQRSARAKQKPSPRVQKMPPKSPRKSLGFRSRFEELVSSKVKRFSKDELKPNPAVSEQEESKKEECNLIDSFDKLRSRQIDLEESNEEIGVEVEVLLESDIDDSSSIYSSPEPKRMKYKDKGLDYVQVSQPRMRILAARKKNNYAKDQFGCYGGK